MLGTESTGETHSTTIHTEDFTQIEGIGPAIASLLGQHGITTYADLSRTSPDHIRQILANAGGNYAAHDPSTWADQAALAAVGEWDKLRAWQDQLDGGRGDSAAVAESTPEIVYEDLTQIEGVGPKIQELLYSHGIYTYATLAQTPVDSIQSILMQAGGTYLNHDPSTWPDQSALAAVGEWDKLKAWQDQLDGGRSTETAATAAPVQEDLTQIEGIGPKIQELLYGHGISSYVDLANATVDQIQSILTQAGGMMASHDPTTWPDQARLAAVGEWDKLKAWQDELDGGRM
ncbi:MAG: helix-hairpin-helix domain-containing protein [Planctomycetota bacterium]